MMGLFRKTPPAKEQEPGKRTLLAAAVSLSDRGVEAWRARQGEDEWQREAWYQYDITGELRFALNWIANAVGLADLYVAEVDPDTGLVTGPTDNATAQAIGRTIMGGPAKRGQMQSTAALNLQVAGEVFLLIRPTRGDEPDAWFALSSTEVSERGGRFKYCDPTTGAQMELDSASDLLIRVWSPHPRLQWHADSAVRASLPTLREIEKASQNIAARLDSRLAGPGLLIIPQEVDFADGDDAPGGPQGFMEYMARAMEASLKNPGSAASQVPIIAEAPGDQVANFERITFESELSDSVLELRTGGLRRLATGLDMPAEIISGMGDSNHWSAWQIEESAYKIHVAPVLDRMGDAITSVFLWPALRAAGITDPERYVVAFDTTEIISRPNRVAETLDLWDRRLVSDDYVREEAGVPDSGVPQEEELERRLIEQLVIASPAILSEPGVAEALGIESIEPAPEEEPEPAPAALPAPETEPVRALPERAEQSDEGLVAAAELVVYDALKRAGGRLLTRPYRGQYGHVPKYELHTVIPCHDTERATEGSFEFVDRVADAFNVNATRLDETLRAYTANLVAGGRKHDREELAAWLSSLIR
jgi:hypothetical protein